jgi:hypothetical protein
MVSFFDYASGVGPLGRRRWHIFLDVKLKTCVAMLGTIVSVICLVWAIEVAAALLMYAWVLCRRRRGQAGPVLAREPAPSALR